MDARDVTLYGYVAYMRLVEARVRNDIGMTRARLKAESGKKPGLMRNMTSASGSRGSGLADTISLKEKWIEKWMEENWKVVSASGGSMSSLQSLSLKHLREWFDSSPEGKYTKYRVLQDAILNELYTPLPTLSNTKGLKEIDPADSRSMVAQKLGLPPGAGLEIVADHDRFIKALQGTWTRIGLSGAAGVLGVTALAAALTGPIAIAIGGAMGLSGAAAFTAGLALLGGGALSAGGAGIVGGLAFILGSSAVVGGVSGASLGAVLSRLPAGLVAHEMSKVCGYIRYLHKTSVASTVTRNLKEDAISDFLQAKHAAERQSVSLSKISVEDRQTMAANRRIMNYALDRITEVLHGE